MTTDRFIGEFVAKLRAKAGELRAYGAGDAAQTSERVAQDLEDSFRSWWLAELTVSEAAKESGYSEERLREMARAGTLPHRKGEGERGHVVIARCDLPRRPKSHQSTVTCLEARLLKPRKAPLRSAS
jgi:hypothetical protein